ncbi:MAG: DUF2027 domain-containing protein [Bacteroidetes bacterium]|nr:DUF2027 domain-containing protein [Bacteroidota bacterium]MCL6103706.1 DUF2027 domain-containing protein [Bacteroidota bacterium]
MATQNIKIGDEVRFMNEVGGGRVTAFLSKEMVSVETQDGFEIPTYIKNLVIIPSTLRLRSGTTPLSDQSHHPAFPSSPPPPLSPSSQSSPSSPSSQSSPSSNDRYPETKRTGFKEVNQQKGNDFPEFIFAALPDNPGNPPEGKILLYLVNDCNYTLIYHFATKMADQYTTVDAGMLEPNTKVELESIQPKGMGELPEYCFQLLFFRKSAAQLEEPVQKEIRISLVKFFKASSFVKNNYFNTPALLIKLTDHPLKAELDKLSDKEFQQITLTKEPKKPVTVELPKTDLVEIDLHIHQLLDDFSGLTNADMLKLQLDTFRKEMDKAISTGVKKIVFIHGIGDGVLKNELRRELQRKYPRFPYQDASFREYGFGATLAVLRK